MTPTSNAVLLIANAPTMQNSRITGISTSRGTRRMRLRDLDAQPAERQHDQVGDDEEQEHRVDVLRVVGEQRRARVHVLHVEHADHDRGDRVARECRTPAPGSRRRRARCCWPRRSRRCPRRGRCRTSPAPCENFLLIAYDIHAAMSAPAPGSAPISVPSALPRRICIGYFTASAHMPLKTLPIGCVDDLRRRPRCRPRSG